MKGVVQNGAMLLLAGTLALSHASPSEAQQRQQGCGKPKSGAGAVVGNALDLFGRKTLGVGGLRTMRDLGIDGRTLLSSTIFCALSAGEAKQASGAQLKALESGKTGKASTQNWSSGERDGVAGGTTVVSRGTSNGQQCAVTSTFITDANGDEKVVEQEQCVGADGKWQQA